MVNFLKLLKANLSYLLDMFNQITPGRWQSKTLILLSIEKLLETEFFIAISRPTGARLPGMQIFIGKGLL